MKEIKLPSGATLSIGDIPFGEAKGVYQAVLRELRAMHFDATNLGAAIKDFYCSSFSSADIESALKVPMARCLYNSIKIDAQTFEPKEARQDYTQICLDVMEECIGPFMRSLSVELERLSKMIRGDRT